MTPKLRTIWFYALLILFFFFGGGVIFYSQGWRFDLESLNIVKTGGIFLSSIPRDAEISVNGEPKENKSGLLQSGTLISDLIPKRYAVELTKNGYHPWRKDIAVLPELVTKYEHILLVPIQEEAVSDDAFPLEGQRAISVTYNYQRDAFIYERRDTGERVNVSALFNALKARELKLPGAVTIKYILAHPNNEHILGALTEHALYLLDVKAQTIKRLSAATPTAAAINAKNIAWGEADGRVGVYSFSGQKTTLLPSRPGERIVKLVTSPSGDVVAMLYSDAALYMTEPNGTELKKISADAKNFEFAPDNERIGIQEGSRFLVYNYRKDEEKRFSVPIQEPVLHMLWYKDSEHLFLISASSIYFSEIDDASPVNVYRIAQDITLLTSPLRDNFGLNTLISANELDDTNAVVYNPSHNTLYFLKKDRLYSFALERNP